MDHNMQLNCDKTFIKGIVKATVYHYLLDMSANLIELKNKLNFEHVYLLSLKLNSKTNEKWWTRCLYGIRLIITIAFYMHQIVDLLEYNKAFYFVKMALVSVIIKMNMIAVMLNVKTWSYYRLAWPNEWNKNETEKVIFLVFLIGLFKVGNYNYIDALPAVTFAHRGHGNTQIK